MTGVAPEINVTVSRRPLHDRERELLLVDLAQRGVSPSLLDVLPPAGRRFQLLRALGTDGQLLGVTTVMSVRPFVSIKQLLGEGNHVGWDTGIYFAHGVDRRRVAAAILEAVARRTLSYAMYFGRLDEEIRAALPLVRHRLLETDYRIGQIDCRTFGDSSDFLAKHKRLRRHLRQHAKSGGTVYLHEGPVGEELARQFSRLVLTTYRHHGGMGRIQFKDYAYRTCGSFFMNSRDAVHIYASENGRLTGLQSFVRHPARLELSEGGFDRSRDTHHAYEAIIAESVDYAVEHGIDFIGYGGIWNAGKDRYTDTEGRETIYLLQLYGGDLRYRIFGDRISRWGFKTYFGGRFGGADGDAVIVSRQAKPRR